MNNEGVPMEEQTGLMCETEPSDQPAEQRLSAPRTDSSATVLALIEQLALDPRADVAKLERVIALYERLTAKAAELAYNAAKGDPARESGWPSPRCYWKSRKCRGGPAVLFSAPPFEGPLTR